MRSGQHPEKGDIMNINQIYLDTLCEMKNIEKEVAKMGESIVGEEFEIREEVHQSVAVMVCVLRENGYYPDPLDVAFAMIYMACDFGPLETANLLLSKMRAVESLEEATMLMRKITKALPEPLKNRARHETGFSSYFTYTVGFWTKWPKCYDNLDGQVVENGKIVNIPDNSDKLVTEKPVKVFNLYHVYDLEGGDLGDGIECRDLVATIRCTEEEIQAFVEKYDKPIAWSDAADLDGNYICTSYEIPDMGLICMHLEYEEVKFKTLEEVAKDPYGIGIMGTFNDYNGSLEKAVDWHPWLRTLKRVSEYLDTDKEITLLHSGDLQRKIWTGAAKDVPKDILDKYVDEAVEKGSRLILYVAY